MNWFILQLWSESRSMNLLNPTSLTMLNGRKSMKLISAIPTAIAGSGFGSFLLVTPNLSNPASSPASTAVDQHQNFYFQWMAWLHMVPHLGCITTWAFYLSLTVFALHEPLICCSNGQYYQRSSMTRCGNSYVALCNTLLCGFKRVEDSHLPKLSQYSRMPFRHIEGSAKTCCYKSQGSDSPVANWPLIQLLHQSLGFLRI